MNYKDMTYAELVTEETRVVRVIGITKSPHAKKDYYKYLKKIQEQMKTFRPHRKDIYETN